MQRPPMLSASMALVALVACSDGAGAPQGEPVATVASAITGGTRDSGDDAVVMLGQVGQAVCTGTIIAPTVVATAAHCLVFPPVTIRVGSGAATSRSIRVAAVHQHPLYSGQSFAHDVGVIILAEAANIPAVALHEGDLTDALDGRAVRVVGFGVSDTTKETAGEKMQGTSVVQAIEADVIKIVPSPAQPCRGDSGGPVLVRDGDVERLIGITSRGDGTCSAYARAIRMDLYRDFLSEEIDSAAPPADPGSGCALAGAPAPWNASRSGVVLVIAWCAALLMRRRRDAT